LDIPSTGDEILGGPSLRFTIVILSTQSQGTIYQLLATTALGKPIVASRVGGVPEPLGQGEAGLLVPPAAPRALADAICTLLADSVRAKTLGAAGRRRAPLYSTRVMIESLEKLYREVLSDGQKA